MNSVVGVLIRTAGGVVMIPVQAVVTGTASGGTGIFLVLIGILAIANTSSRPAATTNAAPVVAAEFTPAQPSESPAQRAARESRLAEESERAAADRARAEKQAQITEAGKRPLSTALEATVVAYPRVEVRAGHYCDLYAGSGFKCRALSWTESTAAVRAVAQKHAIAACHAVNPSQREFYLSMARNLVDVRTMPACTDLPHDAGLTRALRLDLSARYAARQGAALAEAAAL